MNRNLRLWMKKLFSWVEKQSGDAGSGAHIQILSSWNDDESLCLSFETLKPAEPAGHPGRVNRGRFWGPLSPP